MDDQEEEIARWYGLPAAERAYDCLSELIIAAQDLLDIEDLELDGLRGFAEATKHVAMAYRERLVPTEEQRDEVDAS